MLIIWIIQEERAYFSNSSVVSGCYKVVASPRNGFFSSGQKNSQVFPDFIISL